jgi:dihydroneopterin aldolase
MDIIFIKGLKIDAVIGVYPEEKVKTQPILLDIKLYCDISKAALTDDIKFAVDYHKISEEIYIFVKSSRFELIESLAHACTQRLLAYQGVNKVSLKLSKPDALEKAKNVGLIIKRSCK